jgi:hypothetical protein
MKCIRSREYPLHAPGSLFRSSHCAVGFSVHGRVGDSEEAPGQPVPSQAYLLFIVVSTVFMRFR